MEVGVESDDVVDDGMDGFSYDHPAQISVFRQNAVLHFEDGLMEVEFLRFMHPKPLLVVPISFGVVSLLFLQYVVSGGRGPNIEFYTMLWAFISNSLLHVIFHYCVLDESGRDIVLLLQRASTVVAVLVALFLDVYFKMVHLRECATPGGFPVGASSRAYDDANCRFVWVASTVNILAVLFAGSKFIRFPYVLSLCCYTLALYLVMWRFVEPPDIVFNVWLYAVFVAASLAFIAFVQYDQEQVQRQQFIQSRKLMMEQERLAERERSLSEFCSMLLPRSLLRRVGSFEATRTTDESSSGTALVVGIHDFGVWCTQIQPSGVAQGVVQLQSAVRTIATRQKLDFVGSVGDSVACVGNLTVSQRRAAWNSCAALLDVVETVSLSVGDAGGTTELPPLRASAHVGQLWGAFGHGCGGVRYDVFGPAMECAFSALADCPAGRGLASLTLMDAAGASAETFDIVTTVGEESFLVLEKLQPRPDQSMVDRQSTGTEPASFLRFDQIQLALASKMMPATTVTKPLSPRAPASEIETDDAFTLHARPADDEEEKLEPTELRARLERYKEVRMVWCCFPRFVDDEVENAYVSERMEALPEAASRTWFAYGLYVLVILCLLMVDMHEPNGVVGVVLLATASLLSVAMGTIPKVLSRETMSRWYFVWSVVGVILPLLVVYGCAVSRPSAVGNDASLYPLLGAFVRSYCFASSRWQAVVVPLMTVAGLFQYLLPGGYVRYGFFFMLVFIALIVVSEREREGADRENARRKVERRLLLAQSRVEEVLRDGLLRSTLPAPVLSVVKTGLWSGNGSRSQVLVAEGVTMVVRALSGSSSAKRFDALDVALSQCYGILSMSGLLGDQAVVVGPIPHGFRKSDRADEEEMSVAVEAAVVIGSRLAEVRNSALSAEASQLPGLSGKRASFGGSTNGNNDRAFSIVMDVDDVVHSLEVGEFAQYWALGVSVTRLMAIVQGVDVSALHGCLATERVVRRATEFEVVSETHVKSLGPMKIRGAGMMRLMRIDIPQEIQTLQLADASSLN